MKLNEYACLYGRYSLKQRNPLFFFKILIQLYLLRSFLYSLTYCIKEVINGKIFWRLNLKVLTYEAATAWNRRIPCNVSKHWSNYICFIHFSIFDLLYQRGYHRQYFWTLHLKVLAYEAATAWNRGIPCNFSKHWSNCICFVYFSLFDLLYQRGYQRQYSWILNLKVLLSRAL